MSQKFKITHLDGKEYVAKVTPRCEVNTEQHFGIGLGNMQKDGKAEVLYYMAWQAAVVAKREHRSFEEFLDDIDDVTPLEVKEEEEDPTPADQPSAS